MRIAILTFLLCTATAFADDKALKPYIGKIVLSPDPAPATAPELPAYLAANAEKSGHYEFMKWDINFVGVLAKPAEKVTLAVTEVAAKEPLVTIELGVSRTLVVGHFKPTKAAGFAVNKTYAVTLTAGTSIVGKAELVFRE